MIKSFNKRTYSSGTHFAGIDGWFGPGVSLIGSYVLLCPGQVGMLKEWSAKRPSPRQSRIADNHKSSQRTDDLLCSTATTAKRSVHERTDSAVRARLLVAHHRVALDGETSPNQMTLRSSRRSMLN